MKRSLAIFAVILALLTEVSVGASAGILVKKPTCCGPTPCPLQLSCCHPDSQKTLPVPASQTGTQLGNVFALTQSKAILILNDPLPLFSYLGGTTYAANAPPLFILYSSLLI